MAAKIVTERIFILCAAFVMDMLFGDPYFLWHPVRGMGSIISAAEKMLLKLFGIRADREADRGKKLAAGMILVAVTLAFSVGVPLVLLLIAQIIHPVVRILLQCIMCYQLLAMKSLKSESMKVYYALKEKGLAEARTAVSMIVGRDVERLDEEGVIKATVETIAENTSDGVIAPLFYMILFGSLGGFFYKAVNTMDSMVGYKNDRYIYLGRPAAKLDDVMNYIPARVAAIFMILAAFLLGFHGKNAWKIYKRDRYCHASPNSAQTESVCAGALGIRLAGDAWYFGQLYKKPYIGDPKRQVEIEDIPRACRLLYGTSFLTLITGILVLFSMGFI